MTARVLTTPIDAERVRALLPHGGKMCLLERVLEYDAGSIRCDTRSHLDPANPLRRDGHLWAVCGIEYAAQAMALHGALNQPQSDTASVPSSQSDFGRNTPERAARRGYLVSVRDARCQVPYLDDVDTALEVRANMVFGDATSRVYSFAVAAGNTTLISGRAAVMLG